MKKGIKRQITRLIGLLPLGASIAILFSSLHVSYTIEKLHKSATSTLKNFETVQAEFSRPHAGLHAIPAQAQEISYLLRAHNIDSYRLSSLLTPTGCLLVCQRITESAWPSKKEADASYIFKTYDEFDSASQGVEVDRGKEIVLVYDPID